MKRKAGHSRRSGSKLEEEIGETDETARFSGELRKSGVVVIQNTGNYYVRDVPDKTMVLPHGVCLVEFKIGTRKLEPGQEAMIHKVNMKSILHGNGPSAYIWRHFEGLETVNGTNIVRHTEQNAEYFIHHLNEISSAVQMQSVTVDGALEALSVHCLKGFDYRPYLRGWKVTVPNGGSVDVIHFSQRLAYLYALLRHAA